MAEDTPKSDAAASGRGARALELLGVAPGLEAWALLGVVLGPLIYYGLCISPEITFGDGPEILTAVLRRGVIHPSGYPLYSLLGQVPVHLPWATAHWNLAFFLSAVPGALGCGLLYLIARRLSCHIGVASAAALCWGFADNVVFQSTRVEVYALHCLLIAAALWALVRFIQAPAQARWANLAVLAQCLAVCNHLTAVFLVVPLLVGLVAADPRGALRPRRLLLWAGIAAGCALIYLWLPLTATLNTRDSVVWNDPQTVDAFWYHVRGAEYNKYRDFSKLWENLGGFMDHPRMVFGLAALAACFLGLVEGLLRHTRLTVVLVLFVVGSLVYVSSYPISDIYTYYGSIDFAGLVLAALGASWLLEARIPAGWAWGRWVWMAVIAALLALPLSMAWRNRSVAFRDVLAEDMSAMIASELPERAIVLTAVDGHSFPLWYQAYVEHPEREWVMVDRVMFRLKDKKWYRDFLRRRHPDVSFPTEEEMDAQREGAWERTLLDRNQGRYTSWAMLASRWTVPGYYPVNRGWHFELRPDGVGNAAQERTRDAMHIYMARQRWIGGRSWFYDNQRTYPSGRDRLACVAEWWAHNGLTATWTLRGPNGASITYPPHEIPSTATVSWEFFEIDKQTPGVWTCEVAVVGRVELWQSFELTAN